MRPPHLRCLLPFLLCFGALLPSCAAPPAGQPSPTAPAAAGTSTVASLAGAWQCRMIAAAEVAPADAPTIEFAADGRVSGYAGVNRYFGPFLSSAPGVLEFGAIGATRMAGPPERMRLEDSFLAALGRTNGFTVDGRKLQLTDRGQTLLTFERSAER